MQATCVKIGTSDGNVYYSYPSEGKYEFSGIDGVDKETDISYICIAYERKTEPGNMKRLPILIIIIVRTRSCIWTGYPELYEQRLYQQQRIWSRLCQVLL